MSENERLLRDLYSQLSPQEFEQFLSVLLNAMQFSDVRITGRSGDRGIDLEATWTQGNIPGLQIDLPFKIQAKRYSPTSTLSPRYVRELRGSLMAGDWGLLITTGRVTNATLQERFVDPTRMVSIIDGNKLIELCKNFEIGVKREYSVDLSAIVIEEQPLPPQVAEPGARSIQEMLIETLDEQFVRIGTSSIYKSPTRTVIARISQRYDRTDSNYWYGTTPKDLERIREFRVTHFAYVFSNVGVMLIPTTEILEEVNRNNLPVSLNADRKVRHFHIQFYERNEAIYWNLKGRNKDVTMHFQRHA